MPSIGGYHPYGLASILTGLESNRACVGYMLGQRIAARQPSPACLPELRRALRDEWCNIPQDQIDNLILSMPRRSRRVAHQLGRSDCVERRCGTSGSERCHLHEDQAQDALDRPVVKKTTTLKKMNAYSQMHHWPPSRHSDESRFNLSSDDNRVRVWIPRCERFNPAITLQRHTSPTADVMVWVPLS
ncbi:uncharacterized protein TNCV_4157201 [Trichonephila clavipes]|nr:uncharacterized protein TNCV_4157201 [Trichonephila clavipes]